MRILGLDVGDKTIGVAVSDMLGVTAQGLQVIRRSGELNEDMKVLQQLIEEWEVGKIVVGLPRNMNGTSGPREEKVLAFKAELEKNFTLPVETWDERLSTAEAEKVLLEADMSRKKRKKVIDKMAATLILQGYLQNKT